MINEISWPMAVIVAALILSVAMVASAWIIARGRAGAGSGVSDAPWFPPLPPLPPEAFPVEPSGVLVHANTHLEVGKRVLVEWSGGWYRAEVLDVEPGGGVRVHYVGWEPLFDESVPRSRLQVDLGESLKDE